MDSKSSGEKNTTACASASNVIQSSPDIKRGKSSLERGESPESSLPPLPQDPGKEQTDSHRLWIGNVDTRITEFTLLKLLQKFGQLEKFDFLYHKSGPDQGKPRGYCFATYNTKQEAEAAKRGLDGKLALSKRLLVKNAHVDGKGAAEKPQNVPSQSGQNLDRESQIRALEAKLRMMQEGKQDAPCAGSAPSVVEAINSQKASTLPAPSSNRSSKDRQSYRGQPRNYSGSSRPNRTKPYGGRSGR